MEEEEEEGGGLSRLIQLWLRPVEVSRFTVFMMIEHSH